MTTFLLVAFLVAHGLLHLGIWLPRADPKAEPPPPFLPDHSALLTRMSTPQATVRRVSVGLAEVTAAAYVVTGVAVAVGAFWAAGAGIVAAMLALVLKVLYFHPWLSIGVALDLGVLSAALLGWPVGL